MLLRRDLLFAFQDFASTLAVACNYSTKVVAAPIRVIISFFYSYENNYFKHFYLHIFDDINNILHIFCFK